MIAARETFKPSTDEWNTACILTRICNTEYKSRVFGKTFAVKGERFIASDAAPPSRKVETTMRQVLDALNGYTNSDGFDLAEPFTKVPPRRDYPDYHRIVDEPLDIVSISKRVNSKGYSTVSDMIDDIAVMLGNAAVYNPPSSVLISMAVELMTHVRAVADALEDSPNSRSSAKKRAADDSSGSLMPTKKKEKSDSSGSSKLDGFTKPRSNKHGFTYLMGYLQQWEDKEGFLPADLFAKLPSKKELPEYYTVITEPMDLKIVSGRIQGNVYKDYNMFSHDVELIFTNAQHYNEKGSEYYNAAASLLRIFRRERDKLLSQGTCEHLYVYVYVYVCCRI